MNPNEVEVVIRWVDEAEIDKMWSFVGKKKEQPVRIVRLFDKAAIARYGRQFNTKAVAENRPDGNLVISYRYRDGQFNDGTSYRLRYFQPCLYTEQSTPTIEPAKLGPIALRVAPALYGWGLLSAVAEQDLHRVADLDDRNGDGISGRISWVWDITQQRYSPGRLDWKAEQPTLRQQIAAALRHDMGITTALFPDEHCQSSPGDCPPELNDSRLMQLETYLRYLSVPNRRHRDNPKVRHGEQLFSQLGCASCHVPVLITQAHADPALSQQTIWPYTDLLLHDMGLGLADPTAKTDQVAREWRTSPLWGLGLMEQLSEHRFLHDGRARNLMEAILWHGGEAEAAKSRTLALSRAERVALLAFLRSL